MTSHVTRVTAPVLIENATKEGCPITLFVRPLSASQAVGTIPVSDGQFQVTGCRIGRQPRQEWAMRIDGWLDPFWKDLELANWKVGTRRHVGNGEYAWTLMPLNVTKKPGVPACQDLLALVEEMRPLAGLRAERALEIAIAGKVRRVQTTNGVDHWQVQGSNGQVYTTSIQSGTCSCPDALNGAPQDHGAPLCKHRIACIYLQRWSDGKTYLPPNRNSEYVTVYALHSGEWHWQHHRPGGGSLASQQTYPTKAEAVRVGRTIADIRQLPFHLF